MTERARILVVDDDLSMREFLEFMLAREGYDVTLAADGENALMIVPQHHFDLVITDIRMKRVNGIDVLRVVKAVNPDTVVILISAFATTETAVTAMQEGAYDFIPKPFQIEELKGVIPQRPGPADPRGRKPQPGPKSQGRVPFRQSGRPIPGHDQGLRSG